MSDEGLILTHKEEPVHAISKLYKASSTVVIGETHGVASNNRFLEKLTRELSDHIDQLVLEIEPEFQEDVNAYLATGNRQKLASLVTAWSEEELGNARLNTNYLAILEATREKALCVKCVDPLSLETLNYQRTKSFEDVLPEYFENSRSLAYVGAAHAMKLPTCLAGGLSSLYDARTVIQTDDNPRKGFLLLFGLSSLVEEIRNSSSGNESFALDLRNSEIRDLITRRGEPYLSRMNLPKSPFLFDVYDVVIYHPY